MRFGPGPGGNAPDAISQEGSRVEPIVWVILIVAVLAIIAVLLWARRRRSGSVIAVGRRKGGDV